MLVAVTLLWGTTFSVIKTAVAEIPPGALVLVRFLPAAAILTILARSTAIPWRPGLELGFWLWLGYASQAHGLQHTSAGRSAFITAVSVVLVPLMAAALGRRLPRAGWAAAGLALSGVALLTSDGAPPNRGDVWTGVTALSYAWFVLRLEAHAAGRPALPLAAAQLWGVVPFAALWAVAEARADPSRLASASHSTWLAVAYLAVAATALSAWLQTEGQRRVSAPESAVVYSLEPVWAAAFAAWTLGERLGPGGILGAAMVLTAVLVSQARPTWLVAGWSRGRRAEGPDDVPCP